MNIFKILANGDGTINEPNVSAFLGYLLNPYANHGLGFEFLENFLSQIEIQDENFNCLKYDYKVFFEQAFKEEDKNKKIVDIVILCINNNSGNNKETYIKNVLSSGGEIEYIFLIENKIKKSSKTTNQLQEQLDSTIAELSKITKLKISKEKIYSIYITPKEDSLIKEFDRFDSESKSHIYWKDKESLNENTILKLLKNIIKRESNAEIEAINEYTKHTIKSFIQFIECDFKSEKQEEKERSNDGSYTDKYKKLNEETQIERKLSRLKEELIKQNKKLEGILSEPNLTAPRFPHLRAIVNNITICIHAGASSRNSVKFLYQADKSLSNSKQILKAISKQINSEIKKEKYDDAYCRTEDMAVQIPIDEYDKIYTKLEALINNISNVTKFSIEKK